MNRFLRRVLGDDEGKGVEPTEHIIGDPALPSAQRPMAARDFILNCRARPEIEVRFEQVFANALRISTARCLSSTDGQLLKLQIQFNRDERPSQGLGCFHYILRDIPREFGYRIIRKTVLMVTIRNAVTLTFTLKPEIR